MISIFSKYIKKSVCTFFIALTLGGVGGGLLTSCYDNIGGNDHDTALDDVVITLPSDAYSGALGSTITITPNIQTSIPESDLAYSWEANGAVKNKNGRDTFSPLVNEENQTKSLEYVCHLDSNITELNTPYECRLHIRQKSTGRDFYSASVFTITIAGVTGLMILHDDGTSSDIGILEAEDFMPSAISIPETQTANPNHYSIANNGEKIKGKGKSIIQSIAAYLDWATDDVKKRCRIVAATDDGVTLANKDDFSYYGPWGSLFYLQGDRQNYSNRPKGYFVNGQYMYAFDGDDMFAMTQSSTYPFLFPEFTPNTTCSDGHKFALAPFFQAAGTSSVQGILYANSVDGDSSRKGFVFMSQTYYSKVGSYRDKSQLVDTKTDDVPFNPGDMKADLVKMTYDSREHLVAVLKGNSGSKYDGRFFACDINPYGGPVDGGVSSYGKDPLYLYDLSSLTDISNARFFELGATVNMCYYATPSGVYKYSMNMGTLYPSSKLTMTDGTPVNIEGEVTMMKLLYSPNVTRHDSDNVIVVATYANGNAKLYALHIDTMTGLVEKVNKYDETTVEGWKFGYIRDVNIKGM